MLFRYWQFPRDAIAVHIEDVLVLTDAAPISACVDYRGRLKSMSLRYALCVPLEKAADLAAEVPPSW